MEKSVYTHIGRIYGIKCFFNESTMEVKGTNWFRDKLIDLFVFFETTFPINSEFEITILEELKDK